MPLVPVAVPVIGWIPGASIGDQGPPDSSAVAVPTIQLTSWETAIAVQTPLDVSAVAGPTKQQAVRDHKPPPLSASRQSEFISNTVIREQQ